MPGDNSYTNCTRCVSKTTFWPVVTIMVALFMSMTAYAVGKVDRLQEDVGHIKAMVARIDERTK